MENKEGKKRTWKPRERVSPACFPPNHDLLVTVNEVPEVGVVSASQKVILLKGRSVLITNSKVAIEEATGRLKFAPNAPLQPLFPDRSDSQFPLTPRRDNLCCYITFTFSCWRICDNSRCSFCCCDYSRCKGCQLRCCSLHRARIHCCS